MKMHIFFVLIILVTTFSLTTNSINAETGNQTDNQQRDYTTYLVTATWFLAIGTIVIGIITGYTLHKTNHTHKEQNEVVIKLNKTTVLIEILKIMSDKEHRDARRVAYKAKKQYDQTQNIGVFRDPVYYNEVSSTISHFNQIGMLIKRNIIDEEEFFDLHADTVIMTWHALREHVDNERKTNHPTTFYMSHFDWLGDQGEKYWRKNRPGEKLPEIY